jgi:hypothetical protein
MDVEPAKTFRPWLAWLIGGIWLVTALAVLTATRIHPATTTNISLNTRKIAFRTNAGHVLNPSDEEQLLVLGLDSLRIELTTAQMIIVGGKPEPTPTAMMELEGGPSASCSFYQIRSGSFELSGPAILTLDKLNPTDAKSFSLQTHGVLTGNLSSRLAEGSMKPGFECSGVRLNGAPPSDIEGSFSPQGGDSIFLATSADARLDFVLTPQSEVGDTQIPVLDALRFSAIDPRTGDEKSVLLKPPAQIAFEKLDKKVILDDAELLVVVPRNDFYLRQFTVKDGIQLSLHGVVREVQAGAGTSALETLMPSAFDHLDNAKRIYGVIPALVALILGVLEKMGGLGKK